jgi:hypothetical protein
MKTQKSKVHKFSCLQIQESIGIRNIEKKISLPHGGFFTQINIRTVQTIVELSQEIYASQFL